MLGNYNTYCDGRVTHALMIAGRMPQKYTPLS
jgi:hypothetical protein